MKAGLVAFALSTAVSAIGVHLAVIDRLPSFIMSRAFTGLQEAGLPWNTWSSAPRISPQTQTVVRSSPDLAYSVCMLDLSRGPILLTAPMGPDYGSLSVFDDDTTNVFITGVHGAGAPVDVVVAAPDQEVTGVSPDTSVVRLRSDRGLALVRRLAPDQARHEAATALVSQARCTPL